MVSQHYQKEARLTVGDNGDVTVTYPDGSKDTIPGDKVVEGKSDADKNEPKVSGGQGKSRRSKQTNRR